MTIASMIISIIAIIISLALFWYSNKKTNKQHEKTIKNIENNIKSLRHLNFINVLKDFKNKVDIFLTKAIKEHNRIVFDKNRNNRLLEFDSYQFMYREFMGIFYQLNHICINEDKEERLLITIIAKSLGAFNSIYETIAFGNERSDFTDQHSNSKKMNIFSNEPSGLSDFLNYVVSNYFESNLKNKEFLNKIKNRNGQFIFELNGFNQRWKNRKSMILENGIIKSISLVA